MPGVAREQFLKLNKKKYLIKLNKIESAETMLPMGYSRYTGYSSTRGTQGTRGTQVDGVLKGFLNKFQFIRLSGMAGYR